MVQARQRAPRKLGTSPRPDVAAPASAQWFPCGTFALQSFDNTQAAYWCARSAVRCHVRERAQRGARRPRCARVRFRAERWELFKSQYVLANIAYKLGVRKLEFWNEARQRTCSPPLVSPSRDARAASHLPARSRT